MRASYTHLILLLQTLMMIILWNMLKMNLVPNLKSGIVVFWDRLGKSGRKKDPVVQHFNPRAKKLIQDKNCKLVLLPPYGKLFNPCELVNSFLKSEVRKAYTKSPAAATQRARTFRELQKGFRNGSQKNHS